MTMALTSFVVCQINLTLA